MDPHTHPVFLNSREDEFHMRLEGSTYEKIAASGGGIRSSIFDLRNAEISDIISKLKSRMDRFLSFGTTTVECKSGYGLNTESELKSLKAIKEVNDSHPIDMIRLLWGHMLFHMNMKKITKVMLN